MLVLAAAACGGGTSSSTSSVGKAPALRELALLPDEGRLRTQILLGDLAGIRRVYDDGLAFRRALADVWLPDSLAGLDQGDLWRRTFGFGTAAISGFAAAGFHPAEVAVITGRFSPSSIRSALVRRGYRTNGQTLWSGGEGSIDPSTAVGRLVLSALDRVRVTSGRVVAASTAALARNAGAPTRSMAENADLGLAARALGDITAAVIKPARSIQPPAGIAVTPIARHRAEWVAAGVDDRGAAGRIVNIVLVYAQPGAAKADATAFARELPQTALMSPPRMRFGDALRGLRVGVSDGRAVVVSGRLGPGGRAGFWRSLVENGELAVLVGF